MVTLIELKKEKMLALKNHDSDKMNVLGIVISSLQKLEIEKKAAGKEITEVEMVSVLNKTIMQTFKKDYAGKADMALVNKIAREYQG